MSSTSTPDAPLPGEDSLDNFAFSPTLAVHPQSAQPENASIQESSVPAAPPKMRGGFEIDDDEEGGDSEGEDDTDVYDPEFSLQFEDNTASFVENQVDRTSQFPEQEIRITPAPVQAADAPADALSSVPSPASELRADAASPARAAISASGSSGTDAPSNLVSNILKTRLAHDVIGILEDRIRDDPRGDITAWLELIQELKNRNKTEDVRSTYDRFFEIFPLAAEQWCSFVRWEEQNDQKYHMEQIFNKALLKVPDVEFWSIYINYIRRRNSMQSGDTAKSYKIISSAFSFCLEKVGMDKDSGRLWQDYIDFLKSGPGTIGGSDWPDKAKGDAVRDAYQKTLCVPTSALVTLWKEYDTFETGLNKINGRKQLQERSPAYMTARTGFTQLQNLTKDLERTSLPRLPPQIGFEGDIEYAQQVALWKQWIQWEKDDNLVLKEDDFEQYRKRVVFTYRQALMALQFYSEMWYEAAEFCFLTDLKDEGMSFLTEGFKANPESALLAVKLADRIESTTSNDEGNDPGARKRMAQVREPFDRVLDALYGVEKDTQARLQAEIKNIEAAPYVNGDANGDTDLNASNIAVRQAAIDTQVNAIKISTQAHTETLGKIMSYVWIALMRATRRIQGKGLPAEKGAGFRAIFNEARKRGKLTSDFYVESAQIEWQCYRDVTGTRILERGVKLFPEDNYLPLEYIRHLVSKDDMTNARAVFETTVSRFLAAGTQASTDKTRPLFAFFHDYESKYGELSQIERLEARMRELFPEDPALRIFSARYGTPGRFDLMVAHPIISKTQIRPKTFTQPSIEVTNPMNSPIQKVIDHITTANSPKRALEDADDLQPRKIIRAESPLKGAAGRKIGQHQQQQQLQQQPPPPQRLPVAAPPLPPLLHWLLSILPKASSYVDARFEAGKIVELIKNIHLPAPGAVGGARAPLQPQQAPGWPPQYPPPQQPPMPSAGFVASTTQPPPFAAAPFRYA